MFAAVHVGYVAFFCLYLLLPFRSKITCLNLQYAVIIVNILTDCVCTFLPEIGSILHRYTCFM